MPTGDQVNWNESFSIPITNWNSATPSSNFIGYMSDSTDTQFIPVTHTSTSVSGITYMYPNSSPDFSNSAGHLTTGSFQSIPYQNTYYQPQQYARSEVARLQGEIASLRAYINNCMPTPEERHILDELRRTRNGSSQSRDPSLVIVRPQSGNPASPLTHAEYVAQEQERIRRDIMRHEIELTRTLLDTQLARVGNPAPPVDRDAELARVAAMIRAEQAKIEQQKKELPTIGARRINFEL